MDGELWLIPDAYVHCGLPSALLWACRPPVLDATTTVSSVTRGAVTSDLPVVTFHLSAPLTPWSAYSHPSLDPTYTTSPSTVGEDEIPFPVRNVHLRVPSPLTAYVLLSLR